jgi:hypothetical protein
VWVYNQTELTIIDGQCKWRKIKTISRIMDIYPISDIRLVAALSIDDQHAAFGGGPAGACMVMIETNSAIGFSGIGETLPPGTNQPVGNGDLNLLVNMREPKGHFWSVYTSVNPANCKKCSCAFLKNLRESETYISDWEAWGGKPVKVGVF